jgi:hypothetical protein
LSWTKAAEFDQIYNQCPVYKSNSLTDNHHHHHHPPSQHTHNDLAKSSSTIHEKKVVSKLSQPEA